MAEKKYLDADGLGRVWDKIKEWLGGGSINVSGSLTINSSTDVIHLNTGGNRCKLELTDCTVEIRYDGAMNIYASNDASDGGKALRVNLSKSFAFFSKYAGNETMFIRSKFGMALVAFDESNYSQKCIITNKLSLPIRVYAFNISGTSSPSASFIGTVNANSDHELSYSANKMILLMWTAVQ